MNSAQINTQLQPSRARHTGLAGPSSQTLQPLANTEVTAKPASDGSLLSVYVPSGKWALTAQTTGKVGGPLVYTNLGGVKNVINNYPDPYTVILDGQPGAIFFTWQDESSPPNVSTIIVHIPGASSPGKVVIPGVNPLPSGGGLFKKSGTTGGVLTGGGGTTTTGGGTNAGAATTSSKTPYYVAGGVALAALGGAAWWKWGRKR